MISKKILITPIVGYMLLTGCSVPSSFVGMPLHIPIEPVPEGYITDEKYEKEAEIVALEEDMYKSKCEGEVKEYDCAKRKEEIDKKIEKTFIPLVNRLNKLNPELKFTYKEGFAGYKKEWRYPEKHRKSITNMLMGNK